MSERLEQFRGIGPGFDHLRVGLSLSILLWHSFGLSYGLTWTRTVPVFPIPALLAGLLPMFFALSGFLVMGSALRTHDLRVFITFRVLRILPALFTEISLSALLLGPAMTVVPLAVYFSSTQFFEYFGSLIGRVRYDLPGLFVTNPSPLVVNGALWTVGPEILCYIIMALAILSGIYHSRRWMLGFTFAYLAVCIASDQIDSQPIHEILPTRALIFGFLMGAILFHYRERVLYGRGLAAVVAIGSILAIVVAQEAIPYHVAMYPAVAGLAYVIAVIGLTPLPRLPFFHRGDYSYGIYIYGYPIEQSIEHFFPQHREWWFNFALALPITLLFAVTSWHIVEKPVLQLRRKFLPERTNSDGPAMNWGGRRIAIFVALIGYGVFVADAARVFPLRTVAKVIIGKQAQPEKMVRPQF